MGEIINIFYIITKDLAKIKIRIGDVNATNRLFTSPKQKQIGSD